MTALSKTTLTAIVFAMLSGTALADGSGHSHDAKSADSQHMAGMEVFETKLADTSTFGAKGDPKRATITVNIEATEIKYSIESLDVRAGDTIRFVLTNNGEQPHELTIGDAAYQEVARQMMTHMAEMGMDLASPEHAAQHATGGNTIVVLEGETKEVVWTFTKAGTFEFSCNMPGHSEVGMKGTITVAGS